MWTQAETIKFGAEIPSDEVAEYISHELPPDAIVATITIAPYPLNHRFMQVLPFTQNTIDLDQAPSEIAAALRQYSACYLHLPYATSLNPWMNDAIIKWVDRVREICRLPGAQVLKTLSVRPNYVTKVCRLDGC
jgi:hypothetical protein